MASVVPIAKGWSRQVDTGRNPIFYDGSLNADTFRKWLDDNAIFYVAISNGPYDWAATDEAALVRRGLPYLQAVWSDPTWTLYAVTNPRPVISAPGRVIARDPVSLTVSCPSRVNMLCACTGRVTCPPPMAACDELKTAGRRSWLIAPALSRSKAVWYHAIVDAVRLFPGRRNELCRLTR